MSHPSHDLHDPGEEERYRAVRDVELERSGAATELSAWLKDSSWRVRKAAAERLAQVPDRAEVLEVLLAALSERGEPGVRSAAAEALARLGPWALGHVAGLLRHDDPDQRKFAAEILGQMGLPQAEQALLPALDDPDPNVRVAAGESLGRVGGHEAIRALQRALSREDTLLRLCALDALAQLEAPPPLHTLMPFLESPPLRRAAYRLVGRVGDSASAEVVARGLRAEAPQLREAALAALGVLWQRWPSSRRSELDTLFRPYARALVDVSGTVMAALDEEEPDARRGAIYIASLLDGAVEVAQQIAALAGDPHLAPAAAEALSRVPPSVARSLAAALPALPLQARAVVAEAILGAVAADWVPVLLELSATHDPELHLFAVRALGRSGAEAAVDAVVEALSDRAVSNAAVRALVRLSLAHAETIRARLSDQLSRAPSAAAVAAYARIAGPGARPLLALLRRDPDPSLRAAAVEGGADEDGAEEMLRRALGDEAPVVRSAAARAARRVEPAVAAQILRLALGDPELEVVLSAIEAAAEAGTTEVVAELRALASDPQGRVAAQAVRALRQLGDFGGELLWASAGHADPEVVKECLQCAASLPEGEAVALSLLGHGRWDVRAAAARVLGSAGSTQAIPHVRAALSAETDPLVRQVLAEAARVLARR